jgi:hypothetical protein
MALMGFLKCKGRSR